jgi:hypothetical protein
MSRESRTLGGIPGRIHTELEVLMAQARQPAGCKERRSRPSNQEGRPMLEKLALRIPMPMKTPMLARHLFAGALIAAGILLTASPSSAAAGPARVAVADRIAEVNGVRLHYLAAGHGPAVVLLHGYADGCS